MKKDQTKPTNDECIDTFTLYVCVTRWLTDDLIQPQQEQQQQQQYLRDGEL